MITKGKMIYFYSNSFNQFFNPLSPNIDIQILQIDLYTFL